MCFNGLEMLEMFYNNSFANIFYGESTANFRDDWLI